MIIHHFMKMSLKWSENALRNVNNIDVSVSEPLSVDLIKAHSVVVRANIPLEEQLRVAHITR